MPPVYQSVPVWSFLLRIFLCTSRGRIPVPLFAETLTSLRSRLCSHIRPLLPFVLATFPNSQKSHSTVYIILNSKPLKMADQLRSLANPALLLRLPEIIFPFSSTEPLDFSEVSRRGFAGGPPPEMPDDILNRVWPFLVTLSKLGLDNVPDMTTFLPPPSDPSFPRQAMGLQLLLDQMPRRLCRGADCRWTNAYFDVISLCFAQSLDTLSEDEKPWSWARWKDTSTLDFWVLVRCCFVVPFTHTDRPDAQERSLAFTEETRRTIEEATGTTDPHRAQRDGLLSDIYAFPRIIRDGPPMDGAKVEDYTYWFCALIDAHKPIVDRFGHYPYRNAYFGREDTAGEEEWFEKTGDFARPGKEERERLKVDFERGVWTGLDERLHGEAKRVSP